MSKFWGIVSYEYRMSIRRWGIWLAIFAYGLLLLWEWQTEGLVAQSDWSSILELPLQLNMFLPVIVGISGADRLVRDDFIKVRELFSSTPVGSWSYIVGKYLGVLFSALTPTLLLVAILSGVMAAMGASLLLLLELGLAFLLITVPAYAFVLAFSLVCPLVMPVRVYQVLFTGYWFWGNYINPDVFPTLAGSWLTPCGKLAYVGFFNGALVSVDWGATALDATASLILMATGIAVMLALGVAWLEWHVQGVNVFGKGVSGITQRVLMGSGMAVCLLAGIYFAERYSVWLPAYWRIPVAAPKPAESRDERWQQDLDYLAQELPRLHVDAFHSASRVDFEREIAALKSKIPQLSDEVLTLEVMRVTAMVGDAHTRAVPGEETKLRFYPLQLRWIGDGFYVTRAMTATRTALYGRLVEIDGQGVTEVAARLAPWVSHDNEPGLRQRSALFLLSPELLHYLGVVGDMEAATFTFESVDGKRFALTVQPVSEAEYGDYFGNPNSDELGKGLYYRRQADEYYWFEYWEESRTVYVRYGACAQMEKLSFQAFNEQLFAFIDGHAVQRLVLDMRDNGGGDSTVLWPFEQRLKGHALNRRGALYVLVDEGVFSAAMLNVLELRTQTQAQFIGAMPASRPNHYGEVKSFRLANSGMRIDYATKYFQYTAEDGPAFVPDVVIEPTLGDLLAGKDPVLEYLRIRVLQKAREYAGFLFFRAPKRLKISFSAG